MSVRRHFKMYEMQEGKCAYCEIELNYKIVSVDHIIPRSFGGESGKGRNLVLCCQQCNGDKCKVEAHVSDNLSLVEKAESLAQKLEHKAKIRERRGADDTLKYANMARIVSRAAHLYRNRITAKDDLDDESGSGYPRKIPPFMNSLDFDSNA